MAGSLVYGGIDAGGTTFKCGVADADGNLLARRRIAVTQPDETLSLCADFFREAAGAQGLAGLGIASFGPVDVDPASARYGTILDTPKPGWAGTDLRAGFASRLGVSARVDTDVNGALLAEMRAGAAKGARSAAYITIGTGIGAGLYANGGFLGRPLHPEFGHIPVRRHPADRAFQGLCPFHGDCLEGLASARAVEARFGPPEAMGDDHPGWEWVADYLAQAACVLTLALRPERIVLGGGLMLAPHLVGRVRAAWVAQMAGYLGATPGDAQALIVTPGLGDDAGLRGALLLALEHPAGEARPA